jgi:flagellar motor switch protein FliG
VGKTSPEHIKEVERVQEKKLSDPGGIRLNKSGGIGRSQSIILNAIDRGSERYILESLDAQNHDLADEIKSKMFLFEDMSNSTVCPCNVPQEVDNDDLVMALKGVKEPVQDFIFDNSPNGCRKGSEKDEIKGPVRIGCEEAQQKDRQYIRRLEEAGEGVMRADRGTAHWLGISNPQLGPAGSGKPIQLDCRDRTMERADGADGSQQASEARIEATDEMICGA